MSDCVLEDCGSATIGKCMETDQNYFFCMEEMLIPQCDICINSVWVLFDFNSAILLGGGWSNLWEIRPQHLLHFSFLPSPPPLKKNAKCSSKGGGGQICERYVPSTGYIFLFPPSPLKKGANCSSKGGGQKPEKYVLSTCYIFPQKNNENLTKIRVYLKIKEMYWYIFTSP